MSPMTRVLLNDMAYQSSGMGSPRTISPMSRFCENKGSHILAVSGLTGLTIYRMLGMTGIRMIQAKMMEARTMETRTTGTRTTGTRTETVTMTGLTA